MSESTPPEHPSRHFADQAKSYRRYRPAYPAALFRWLADQCEHRRCAVDMGAGNGQAAAGLSPYFERIIAVDRSAEQLGHALPTAGVRFVTADVTSTGLPSPCADLVVAAQALHWFPREAFYAEVDRLLVSGGIFAAWTYQWVQVTEAIDEVVHKLATETLAPYWPPERALVNEGYRSVVMPWPELEVPAFTMAVKWTFEELLGYIETWSASRAYREEQGASVSDRVRPRLAALWGDEIRREVSWPLVVRACRKE